MSDKENFAFAGIAIATLILGILAIVMILFTGCVINNENIIQYGPDDTLKETEHVDGQLESAIQIPLKQL